MSIEVPFTCWETPGFKDCQKAILGDAYNVCKAQGIPEKVKSWAGLGPEEVNPDWTNCYQNTSDQLLLRNCVNKLCPNGRSSWLPILFVALGAGALWYYTRKN